MNDPEQPSSSVSGGLSPLPGGNSQRIQTVCLVLLATVAVSAAVHWLRPMLIPFVLALFLSLGLTAVVDRLTAIGLRRWLAVSATAAFTVVLFVLLGLVITASVNQLRRNSTAYQTQLRKLLDRISEQLPEGTRLQRELESVLADVTLDSVGVLLVGTTNAILDILSRSTLVLIFVGFLMVGMLGRAGPAPGVLGQIELRIRRYLVTKVTVSAATGLLVGAILTALGVPLALVFGLFAFLLNFIPNLGSLIATLLPLPVVLVDPNISVSTAVLAIVLPGAVQMIIGNVLEPKVMGESLDLHPVVILLALIFWGMLWGIVGALLATPITAVVKIIFERFPETRALAHLMAGRLDRLLAQ